MADDLNAVLYRRDQLRNEERHQNEKANEERRKLMALRRELKAANRRVSELCMEHARKARTAG